MSRCCCSGISGHSPIGPDEGDCQKEKERISTNYDHGKEQAGENSMSYLAVGGGRLEGAHDGAEVVQSLIMF